MKIIFLFFLLAKLIYALPIELLDKHILTEKPETEYLIDKKGLLDIQSILGKRGEFVKAKKEQIIVNSDDAVWFRFVFTDKTGDTARWFLYHSLVRFDRLEFFCVDASGEVKKFIAGDLIEFHKKQVPSRYQALFFELKPNESLEIFVKATNKGRITPDFVLSPAAKFIEKNSGENLIWGVYFGFFIAIIFYSLWLFVTLRDKLYGVYMLNIVSTFAMMFVLFGFIQPILPEFLLAHIDISPRFFSVFAMLMFIIFLSLFFETKKRFKAIHTLLLLAILPLIILCLVSIFDIFVGRTTNLYLDILFAFSLFYATLTLFVSSFMLYKKQRWAGYIFAISVINTAWIIILLLSLKVIIDEYGIVEKLGIIKNIIHVAVLSIVLGLRFSWLKKEKETSDKLFMEQSKRSLAGDMAANITHQWKQPIAELSAVLSAVKSDIKSDRLDAVILQKDCDKAFEILKKMASSVDFFQDFFRLDQKKEKLEVAVILQKATDAYLHSFEKLGVALKIQKDDECVVCADSNGLLQVFSIILQNSKEAFEENKTVNPKISISIYSQNSFVVTEFADNGGGCDEAMAGKIFNPFFGTKKGSTGSGLYLAKTIVEQKMGGEISAKNKNGGLAVTVKLPDYLTISR